MTTHLTRSMTTALLAAAVACGRSSGAAPQPAPETSSNATATRVRADSLRRPYTEADVRFMTDMIGHHAQALVMAGWAPTHGAEPSIRILAERIINAQQDEIATMQHWLGDRGHPVADGMAHGTSHDGHAMTMPGMMMPGMLTPAQMASLDSARGPAFDRLFLTGMIQHHRGAVAMVQQLFDTPGAARDETVFKFANDVNVDQSTEIARMETMLATLTPERSSP
ncbi:MAG: DUF305 domain-containing protein [Gemmatimonadales bacterium]